LPLQKLEEKSKIAFEESKLDEKTQKKYKKLVDEKIENLLGDPLTIAQEMLAPFETPAFKSEKLVNDLYHKNVLFHKKLDVINSEFDEMIAALVAQLIFKQHVVNEQKKVLLDHVKNSRDVNGTAAILKSELSNNSHLLYVDDTLRFNSNERHAFTNAQFDPNDAFLRKRMTMIAENAMKFLKKLSVPKESIFSDQKFFRTLRLRAEVAKRTQKHSEVEGNAAYPFVLPRQH
jgi:hypothetical protein